MQNSIGERIKKSRMAKGLSQDDVARLMEVTRGAVANWEHNRSFPPAKNFPRLASILGVSASYLQLESDLPLSNEIPLPDDIKKVPIIATVKCGVNGLAFEEELGFVNVNARHGEDIRAFRCRGDSMINEGIYDGDIAIVRIQNEVESGELAIVVINGDEGTLKKVRYQDDAIILEAANPNYPARIFVGVDKAVVHIVGKVIETRRMWS